MTADVIRDLVAQRPFVPFRLHVGGVATYDIRRPDMILVGNRILGIGLRRDMDSPFFDEAAMVDTRHVTRIEPLAEAAPAG